jgi:P63C domain
VGASAKAGIKGLAYALAGYNPSAQEVIDAFKLYVQEEARKYEPEFPSELYMEWHRLYSIPVPDRGKPWHFKYLTVNHVYTPVANSNGKILELTRIMKAKDGDRQLFQFLNAIGARALRIQLGRILEMAQSSKNQEEYEAKIVERFGGQRSLELVYVPKPSSA